MKKIYQTTRVEITRLNTKELMIPSGISIGEPFSPMPKGHFRPGPGASYDPQGNIL